MGLRETVTAQKFEPVEKNKERDLENIISKLDEAVDRLEANVAVTRQTCDRVYGGGVESGDGSKPLPPERPGYLGQFDRLVRQLNERIDRLSEINSRLGGL